MKNVARLAGAALMALTASTAQAAGEARVEVGGAIGWTLPNGNTISTVTGVGLGAGYDFDIGGNAFIGPEVGVGIALTDGANIGWGVGGRAGAKLSNATRLYISGGLTFGEGITVPYAGIGLQHKFDSSIYGKIGYSRGFDVIDAHSVGVGFGFTF